MKSHHLENHEIWKHNICKWNHVEGLSKKFRLCQASIGKQRSAKWVSEGRVFLPVYTPSSNEGWVAEWRHLFAEIRVQIQKACKKENSSRVWTILAQLLLHCRIRWCCNTQGLVCLSTHFLHAHRDTFCLGERSLFCHGCLLSQNGWTQCFCPLALGVDWGGILSLPRFRLCLAFGNDHPGGSHFIPSFLEGKLGPGSTPPTS